MSGGHNDGNEHQGKDHGGHDGRYNDPANVPRTAGLSIDNLSGHKLLLAACSRFLNGALGRMVQLVGPNPREQLANRHKAIPRLLEALNNLRQHLDCGQFTAVQ